MYELASVIQEESGVPEVVVALKLQLSITLVVAKVHEEGKLSQYFSPSSHEDGNFALG